MKGLQVRSKLWLEVDGEPLLGNGRDQLLRLVHDHGSINAAARDMGLTYRKAWSLLKAMEDKLGRALVLRSKGGAGGGESQLTPEALDLLAKYDQLRRGVQELVDAKFAELF